MTDGIVRIRGAAALGRRSLKDGKRKSFSAEKARNQVR